MGDFEDVISDFETYLETVDENKIIHKIQVTVTGNIWYGYILHDEEATP